MSTLDDDYINRLEVHIAKFNAEVERLEVDIVAAGAKIVSDPSNQQLLKQEEQLRDKENNLRAQLVEMCKEKTILQRKKAAAQAHAQRIAEMAAAAQARAAPVAAEPAYDLLHWGYNSVETSGTSRNSHTRLYCGDCELVNLPLDQFCPIVKAKMRGVTSGVTMPAIAAMQMRTSAAGVEAEADGTVNPLTGEDELNPRFRMVVGMGVADVVNACILQKQPTWSQLYFRAGASPSDSLCRPDFLIKQEGADVCGGEGKMPNVMGNADDLLTTKRDSVKNILMQACSYCLEKKWRFTFITSYNLTFFVWRVAEDKYAVTDGFLAEEALCGLYTREVLAYIIWMSLESPWGNQLPQEDGALQALEAQLKQQAAKVVLRGKAKEHSKLCSKDSSEPSQVMDTQSWTLGSKWQQETPALPLNSSKDKLAYWAPVQDAPEYPLASLQLSSICLGAGQCGRVVQGWLWGVPVAVKGTDACKSPDTVELLWHEAQIYDVLKDMQGHYLPVLHGSGYWRGRNSFFLATAVVAGEPLCNPSTVATGVQAVAQSAKEALQAIHQRGVAHGDVRADNLLVQHHGSKPQVYIIDFGHAYLNPTPEQCERELEELSEVLEAIEMAGAQPSGTPFEAETIQLGNPAVLHGDEIKHFHVTLDGEELFQKYKLLGDEHMQLTSDKKTSEHNVVVMGKDKDFVGAHKTHAKGAKPVKELPNRVVRIHRSGHAPKVINRMGAAGRLMRL